MDEIEIAMDEKKFPSRSSLPHFHSSPNFSADSFTVNTLIATSNVVLLGELLRRID